MPRSLLRRFLPSMCALALGLTMLAPSPAAAQRSSTPAVNGGRGNGGGNTGGNGGGNTGGNAGGNRPGRKVPELDASTGVAALALMIGGGLVVAGRRRRSN